ncbi:PREDICTED: transportin MOS14-like [Camelina sativa]|uniref:Transportin MOS14-like n=1 Tax=Camelina sativa TaxID=90675 RepID=A0ABM0X9A3_CAMSA|nr:PREDICTED: transportin MOS14-like [Camelina sativa]XP_010482583.1 PREDICTED: transportin MOS14-like [Camelina sativa]XP_010482584.1 PREDICTED: transportin MOS14-like [Camelina sativa]XP_010482586.1 PREDICTED: transportin MOS14-like [Camelina sativa]
MDSWSSACLSSIGAFSSLKFYLLERLIYTRLNFISELIHHTTSPSSGGISAQTPLIQVIVPQILRLKIHLRGSSKDDEDVKAIGRSFADVSDSYVELIATGSDESMVIVHALLEVTSHPEFDIASTTFNFWHSLHSSTYVDKEVGFRVQYPEDSQGLSYEDLKEIKQTRYGNQSCLWLVLNITEDQDLSRSEV